MNASFKTEGTYSPDALIAGNHHLLVGRKVTILAGRVLARGALLGKVTASGKYILSLSTASDGSQTPDMVLSEAVDATAGDVQAMAYARGDFNSTAMTIGAAHTVASVTEGLRAKGVVLFTGMA